MLFATFNDNLTSQWGNLHCPKLVILFTNSSPCQHSDLAEMNFHSFMRSYKS